MKALVMAFSNSAYSRWTFPENIQCNVAWPLREPTEIPAKQQFFSNSDEWELQLNSLWFPHILEDEFLQVQCLKVWKTVLLCPYFTGGSEKHLTLHWISSSEVIKRTHEEFYVKQNEVEETQSLSGQQEAGAVQRQRDVPPLPTLQPRVPVRQLFLLQMREKCPMPCPHPRSTFNSGMEGPRRNQLWLAGSYFFPKWEKNARCPVPIPDPHFIRGWRGREETN